MDGQLILSYPAWWIIPCLLSGTAAAWFLYRRDTVLAEYPMLRALLFAFRALVISALALLLLGPLWRGWIQRTERPVLLYLEDVSSSIADYTDPSELQRFRTSRDEMLDALESDFEVERYRFGSELFEWNDSVPGADRSTDLSGALERLMERHSYQHVGAIILASDGIYNQGTDPASAGPGRGTTVYTVALGDTTASRDLFIQELLYPKVVYSGDQFQLDIEWGARHLKGSDFTLRVRDEAGKEWLRKQIALGSNDAYGRVSVVIDAGPPGIRKIRVDAVTSATEEVASNNTSNAYVEILDGRKKVLILYDSPHPDVQAFRSVIDRNKNYEVEVMPLRAFRGSPANYDLVVLHGWPSQTRVDLSESVWRDCLREGVSVMAVLSEGSVLRKFNELQSVLRIETAGQRANEVQGLVDPTFSEFRLPEGLGDALRNYPPILAPFGEYTSGSGTRTILYQRLGDINTGYPLMAAGREENSAVMILAGEGWWRWRMSEFARRGDTEVFDQLMNQCIQYVSVREDKRKFRLFVRKNLVMENEPVRFTAELYNANYELVNEAEVQLEIRSEDGESYPFTMDRSLNAYQLNAGLLPVGSYTATARASWSGDEFAAEVRFTVREVALESLRRQADHRALFNLSTASGGRMYLPGGMEELTAAVREDVHLKPVLYRSEKTTPLIDLKWIFFLLLGLLAVEWGLRKAFGGY